MAVMFSSGERSPTLVERVQGIFTDGAAANIADFHKNIAEGNYENVTVEPSVRSNLVTILGRTAAYTGEIFCWDDMLRKKEKLTADFKGIERINPQAQHSRASARIGENNMKMIDRRRFLMTLGRGYRMLENSPHPPVVPKGAPRKPNVLLILTDDLGSIDTHLYGAKDLITPNLDRLAKEGTRFSSVLRRRACLFAFPRRDHDGPESSTRRTARQRALTTRTRGDESPTDHHRRDAETRWDTQRVMWGNGIWAIRRKPVPTIRDSIIPSVTWAGCIDNYSHFFYWSGPQPS